MLPDNILFTDDPAKEITALIKRGNYAQVIVLTDENTQQHCYPVIAAAVAKAPVIVLPPGEEHKTLATCTSVWQQLTDLHTDRHALMIILGGGVLGDLGGFCAATYKRGIDFVLVPTTLLAQVDASIGGKLGVDFNHFKNHIGVFQLPVMTLLYAGFLTTLPKAELRSGFAEVIKHVLTSDALMWSRISSHGLENQEWEVLIRHSVEFKARVVGEDPREKGLRKILNAGHTIGHALESYFISEGNRVLHGDAVAAGLVAESYIARKRGLITAEELTAIRHFVGGVYGTIQLTKEQIGSISAYALQDKKNVGNKIMAVLLKGIGSAQWDCEITQEEINEALAYYSGQM